MYIIAKIFFAYATLASFLLQFYVPMDFLEPPILERLNPKSRNDIKFLIQILFRSTIVLFIGKIHCANGNTVSFACQTSPQFLAHKQFQNCEY